MSSFKHLRIDKPDTMQNESVHITVEGLEPNTLYKLVMSLEHLYGRHKALAVFKADDAGYIDLVRDAPLRGTYSGVDPMGLFLSQRATPEFPYGGYLRCTPPIPFYYDLELYDITDKHIETMTIKKHWMHPKLRRTEIASHGFYGTEFKPPGDGPYPCVIDISGTGGGLHEHKGAMLASEGFVVVCVAFFQFKDLPHKLEDVDITYFQGPIDFLLSRPYTRKDVGIGLQGVSFGATLVDYLATRYPQFKAVVSINGPHSQSHYMSIKENGVQMVQVPFDDSRHYIVNSVMITGPCFASPTEKLTPENEIEWERIPKDTKFRLVTSVDDLVCCSVHTNNYRRRRLLETGHQVEIEYCNGGHIMEPPYFPHHELVYAKFQGFYCGYGGEVALHGKSQEVTWKHTIEFFIRCLGEPAHMPDWNRMRHILKPHIDEQRQLTKKPWPPVVEEQQENEQQQQLNSKL